jgi:transcriptional regulator of heat shock response
LAKDLSSITKSLGIVYSWDNNEFYKTGLEHILNDKTIESLQELSLIAKSIDELEKNIKSLKSQLHDNQINVFVGKNNPLIKTDKLSFIGTKSNKNKLLIGILSPKVTSYEEHFKLFKSLINSLN